ncbi:MAG: hypothetical protein PHI58_04180 [Candidatus Omnitrophica bacterium]|nr:hypothetical protein [Candidatus Omnitrophota bacterium]
MKKKDISPEEKLLNLIKNKKHSSPAAHNEAPGKTAAAVFDETPSKIPGPDPVKEQDAAQARAVISKTEERVSGILKNEIFKSKVFEPSRLKAVNRYLIIVLGILSLYFFIDLIFVRPYKNVQSIVSKAGLSESGNGIRAGYKDTTVVKDYSSYSGAVSGKSVFGKSAGASGAGDNITTEDNLPERIGLVGIMAGDDPQAIIEDKKVQKTYYLRRGQSFDGYVVEEIADDKVILDYQGKKISLFL